MPLPRKTATERETDWQQSFESLRAALLELPEGAKHMHRSWNDDFKRVYIDLDLLYALDGRRIPYPPPDVDWETAGSCRLSAGTKADYAEWSGWVAEVDEELAWRRVVTSNVSDARTGSLRMDRIEPIFSARDISMAREMLTNARALVRWTAEARNLLDNQPAASIDWSAIGLSVLGSLYRAQSEMDAVSTLGKSRAASLAIKALARATTGDCGSIYDWEKATGRQHGEVLTAFDAAIEYCQR